jgi:prepilin-type N-terminal cleavage/methylation domain-containing protein
VKPRAGFTLAEVAVTLLIVGIALVYVLQGLNTSKATARATANAKIGREMALLTLARVESGLFQEDLASGATDTTGVTLSGSYSEEGYPEWTWVVKVGDEAFEDTQSADEPHLQYDTFAAREQREKERLQEAESSSSRSSTASDEEERAEQPFEKVRVRVSWPRMGELPHQLTLERWILWDQVYGKPEEEEAATNTGSEVAQPSSASSSEDSGR